jgi:hypothetical protein
LRNNVTEPLDPGMTPRERANRRSKRKIAERYAMRRAAFTIVSAENLSVFFDEK